MDELLAQFRLESPELVQRASDELLALERAPGDRGPLDGAFRAIHTLKGSVALFEMAPLGEALHAAEDWLGAVRAGALAVAADRVSALLQLLDHAERWFDALGPDGRLPAAAAEVCAELSSRLAGAAPTGSAPAPQPTPAWAEAFLAARPDAIEREGARLLVRYTPDPDCFFRGEDPLALVARLPGLLALEITPRAPWPPSEQLDPFRCNLVLTALLAAPREAAQTVMRLVGKAVELHELPAPHARPATPPPPDSSDLGGAGQARWLRIDPARVDALLEATQDLVSLNVAFGQLEVDGAAARALALQQQQLDRLSGELHAAVMRLRLAPMSRTFERLPRLARDLAKRLGKPVSLELAGAEAEADRTVVDGLFEPLLHLVRNAIDHGVEPPASRQAAGKPAQATVRITARTEGGELRVEVMDDGAGVELDAVRRRAVARGLLDAAGAAALRPDDAAELLFQPGFSTAATVSEVSGRGVGLDSVRRALEALGGGASLVSVPGQGSVATLRAPISAALIRLLQVQVGVESYGVPLSAVAETGRLPRGGVVPVGAGEAVMWRDRVTPLVWLHDRLGLPRPAPSEQLRLLIAGNEAERSAFVVDGLRGRTSGVLRPLPTLLAGLRGMLGTTLDGHGEVMFVLDVAELAR